MKISCLLCAALLFFCMCYADTSSCQTPNSRLISSRVSASTHQLSSELTFIENKGQLSDQNGDSMPEVRYYSDAGGMKCYLTETGMHFVFSKEIPSVGGAFGPHAGTSERRVHPTTKEDTLVLLRLDMEFAGANPHPRIEAENMADAYYNYYLPHCKLTRVRGYRKIIYYDLYPQIDFVIYSKGIDTKYDFIIHPGGDPGRITMRYSGMDSLKFSEEGKFKVSTPLGVLEEDEPYTYQDFQKPATIPSHFILEDNVLRFSLGEYDKSSDLIIDPIRRMWGTYYGGGTSDGSTLDLGQSPVVDKENNIIFCGSTQSTAGISTAGMHQIAIAGAQDVFLAKFSSSGNLLWATYFGGNRNEFSAGLAMDSDEYLVLYGETESSSGIATPGAHQTALSGLSDEFLARFDDFGTLQWATYFGGDAGEDVGGNRSVACDRGGHIYITGSTFSRNGLATPGAWDPVLSGSLEDCFLAKFNSSDSLLWATYYGGTSGDNGWAIATDNFGNVFFGGNSTSTTGIATTTGFQSVFAGGQADAFIAKFNGSGGLSWGTYYGGSGDDYLTGLCTDSSGNIYGCGYTSSRTGIASPASFQQNPGSTTSGDRDGFIVKLNTSGKRQWATYFGGENPDFAEDIELNANELLISGETESNTSIATSDAYQSTIIQKQGSSVPYPDAFLVKFNYDGFRLWSSYYGGEFTDYGYGCAVDRDNNLILVGETQSFTNIATPGSHRSVGGSSPLLHDANLDAYMVKLCDMVTPVLNGKNDTICIDGIDTLRLNHGYDQIDWFDGNTSLPDFKDSLTYILASPLSPGLHLVYAHVSNGAQCDAFTDTIHYFVEAPLIVDAGADTAVCTGTTVALSGKIQSGLPPYTYLWSPATGLSDPKKFNPKATPSVTTTYIFLVTDKFGCVGADSVTITINTPPQFNPNLEDTICAGSSIPIGDSASGAKPPYIYTWSPRAGLSADDIAVPIASPKISTTYTEVVTDANGCVSQKKINVTVNSRPIPIIDGPNAVCVPSNDFYSNVGIGKGAYKWTLSGGGAITNLSHPDSIVVLWTTAGKWTLGLTVTNAQGCSADTSFIVTVGSSLTPTIIPNGNLSFCSGDSIILHANKGYASYKWSDGSKADSLIVKQSGNFSVTVTDNGGCSGTSTITSITENPSPLITISTDGPTHLCSGGTVHLTASPGFNNYLWSTGETTQTIAVSAAGSYTVQVTNNFGCTTTTTPIVVTINANLTPAITPSGRLSFCEGDSVTLDAGQGYSTYQWSKDGTPIQGATNYLLTVGESGSYTVMVTSGSCSGISIPIIVVVFPLPPQPVITAIGSVLTSSPATSYQWLLNGQPISGGTNQSLTATTLGSYTVDITDLNGCSNESGPYTFGANAEAIVAVGLVAQRDPGGKLEVPIELIASQNLIASNANHYVGTLRYNGTMIIPTGSNGGIIGGSTGVTGSADRLLKFEGNSAPLTSGILQKIQFDAALGDDTCTSLIIDTFYWTDANVDVTRNNGEFCESGICIAGGGIRLIDPTGKLSIGIIRPNPATNHISVEYDLLETGRTQIILSDGIGREARHIKDDDEKAGHYNLDISLDGISSGYYQLMIKTPSQFLSRSFVIQK